MGVYMKVTDSRNAVLRGDVNLQGHAGWITLQEFDFGESPSFSAVLADAGLDETMSAEFAKALGVKNAKPDSKRPLFGTTVKVNKHSDISSPGLMDWAVKGDGRTVQIDCCLETGKPFYALTLKNARVRSFKVDGEDQVGNPTERVEFSWSSFEISTVELDEENRSTATENYSYTRPKVAAAQEESASVDFDDLTLTTAHVAPTEDERRPGPQHKRLLEVDAVGGHDFALLSFRGREALSQLFEFDLELSSSDETIPAADVVGQPIAFRIVDDEGIDSDDAGPDRLFHGRIRRFWACGTLDGGTRRYRAEVVPWLWFLTKRSGCRVFQEKSVVEIVEAVLGDAGFSDFEKNRVLEVYPKLDYCVQYRETDFEFISRLLEEAGIFYFFRHEASKHVLVLADDKTVHTMCEEKDVFHSTGDSHPKRLHVWEHGWELVAKKAALRDYNYLTPTDNLQVESNSAVDLPNTDKLELYEYPGRYLKKTDGDRVAKARIQAEEAAHDVALGKGNWDALEVGRMFTFKEHEIDSEVGKTYVVASIEHKASQLNDQDGASVDYHSAFTCFPNRVLYRPARVHRRPQVAGPQTALVVGPAGEEINTDKYGRVKVQFHWDRLGKKDEKSSCWIRVAQSLAGKGWGALALPRVGQEVVVEFLDGDPDRPLVTGSVYNETALPLDLPAKKTQTLLRTRSTKEGGDENFSELRFDDAKGSEQIYFHAEKDFERVVEHDDKLAIGKDGDGSRTVLIEKDSTLTINKGNRVESLTEGNDTLTIEKGDRTIEVKTGKETVTIKGDRTVTIQSGKDVLEVTSGDQNVKVGGKTEIESKTGFKVTVSGGKVQLEGQNGVELVCGATKLMLKPTGILLDAMKIELKAGLEAKVKGTMVAVDASGILTAKGGLTKIG